MEAPFRDDLDGLDARMVERYRRGKGKRKLLGNHQKCWIWGRNTVAETLAAGRWDILELHLADSLPTEERESLQNIARRQDVPVAVEPAEQLHRTCKSAEHQGVIAKMPPFPYSDPQAVLTARPPCPLYVILDAIQDPFNFGAIVRSAEVLGVDAVFIGENQQVGVTSLVARTSAGAVNHIPIARVPDLTEFVRRLRETPVCIVGASAEAKVPVHQYDFQKPTAMIVGNEGRGISEELLLLCDETLRIPQSGRVGSLNAAVAASIIFYEASRQRRERAKSNQPKTAKRPV